MSSGVTVEDSAVHKYQEMKKCKDRQSLTRIRMMVLHIENKKSVKVEKVFLQSDLEDAEDMYKYFLNELKPKTCRYILYDCEYETDETPGDKLVFAMWTPDTATVVDKMLYASSKCSVAKAFDGVHVIITVNDVSDVKNLDDFARHLGKGVKSVEGRCCTKH